jgi:hypothetical protein
VRIRVVGGLGCLAMRMVCVAVTLGVAIVAVVVRLSRRGGGVSVYAGHGLVLIFLVW